MRSWHSARLIDRTLVDEGLALLRLEVPAAVSGAFARPGQFHRARVGDAEAMFAIASSPGAATFEYLIRTAGRVAEQLVALPLGHELEVTAPEGQGFPLEAAAGHDLLLVGTGTALAPLRSVLGLVAARRAQFGRVTLLQGQRSPRQLPWLDELEALPSVDVRTIVTEGGSGWSGPVGLVQALVPAAVTADTVAFLVGQREMTNDVTALLETHGVAKARVFLNV